MLGATLLPPGWSAWSIPVNAFAAAMGCSLLIHFLSSRRGMGTETVVLLGIALVFTFNAALAALEYIASEQALAAVVFWTMGSLGRTTWPKLGITAGCLLLAWPLFARQAWALTALRLGEQKAASFGIAVGRLRLRTTLLVSGLACRFWWLMVRHGSVPVKVRPLIKELGPTEGAAAAAQSTAPRGPRRTDTVLRRLCTRMGLLL